MSKREKFPAIILAGGLGTRLRAVNPEQPKPMVEIHGKPFLHWLILNLQNAHFDHFVFSIGYKATFIENYPWSVDFPNLKFEFVTEDEPLGTGGAVKNIFSIHKGLTHGWIINGDTFLEHPLPAFKPSSDEVQYTALSPNLVFDAKPNLVTKEDRVTEVREGHGTVFDGGQVFVTRKTIDSYDGSIPCSFHQLIEPSFAKGKVGFCITPGTCYDIGTPERLKRFEKYLERSNLKN